MYSDKKSIISFLILKPIIPPLFWHRFVPLLPPPHSLAPVFPLPPPPPPPHSHIHDQILFDTAVAIRNSIPFHGSICTEESLQ